jgi:hypothetical protein
VIENKRPRNLVQMLRGLNRKKKNYSAAATNTMFQRKTYFMNSVIIEFVFEIYYYLLIDYQLFSDDANYLIIITQSQICKK